MKKPVLLSAVLALGLSGCFQTTFVNPGVPEGEEHDPWVSFFMFGLAGEADVDVRDFCPGEVASVGVGQNGGTWIVSLLTLGIYTPRKVYITCAAEGPVAPTAEIQLDADGQPTRVVKRIGGQRFEGDAEALGQGKYRVALREVGR